MGKIKDYISKIVDNENEEDMQELSDMLDELINYLKEENPKKYDKYKMKLYGMAYDYKFDRQHAEEIVHSMKPLGELWNYETIESVKNKYSINDVSTCDLYIVMNSLANDYGNIISTDDVATYVKMSKAFINDEDAKNNKVWIYYNKIPM